MSEIFSFIDEMRDSISSKAKDNVSKINELLNEFVEKNLANREIPKDEIMEFLSKLGDLLVPFCMKDTYVKLESTGISNELCKKVYQILINNGYQPVDKNSAYIVDSIMNDHIGYTPCRVGDMGVHIPKSIAGEVFSNPDMLVDYCVGNFLYDLQRSMVSSVYYDFATVHCDIKERKSSK